MINNKIFDAATALTETEYQIMIVEGRIFVTTARFIGAVASKLIGEQYDYAEEERLYGGSLIVKTPHSWAEAEIIAKARGWNEKVDGVLCDEIPFNDTSHLKKFDN